MDIRKVKKLIEMLEESQLNEIEIKEGEESVKLVKAISVPVQEQIVTSNAVAPAPQPAVVSDNVSAETLSLTTAGCGAGATALDVTICS